MTGITRLPFTERETKFGIAGEPASRVEPERAALTSVMDIRMLLSLIKIILQYRDVQSSVS
jgi:hypothetical protein